MIKGNSNSSLRKASEQKNDEFYTQIEDVERELQHYKKHLKDKIVFCNCDDPLESNFFRYFALNFTHLGLKKLVTTHFDYKKSSYKLEITGDMNDDGRINEEDVVKTPLKQNGDFRSLEAVEILEEADIVVTNPPFSLFREYVAQLIEYKKNFLIIGNQNAIHYKEIFPLIRDNKLWLGYNNGAKKYRVPNDYENKNVIEIDGKKFVSMGNTNWFTNLDTKKRHEELILYKKYSTSEYSTYDNYDAIEVGKVAEIPFDYEGEIGVPDTFLDKYNPDQFEIIGIPFGNLGKELGVTKNYRGRTDISVTRDGKTKCPFSRIIIKKVV